MQLSSRARNGFDSIDSMQTLKQLLCCSLGTGSLPPRGSTDWPRLLWLARRQGVAGYLYPWVRGHAAGLAPDPAVLAEWHGLYLRAVAKHTRIMQQAADVARAFREDGIRCLPLKGLWLAETLYPFPGQRNMSDMDWLVRDDDVERAVERLRALGYRTSKPIVRTAYTSDVAFRHPEWRCPIELHWHLGSRRFELGPLPDIDATWNQTVPGRIAGEICEVLTVEEHLALLVYHLAHHRFSLPLRAYLDLALLLRFFKEHPPEVQALESACARWHVTRAAPLTLLTTMDFFALDAGEPLARWLPSDPNWEIGRRRELAAFMTALDTDPGGMPAESTWVALRQRPFRSRPAFLLRRIFMPAEFVRNERGGKGHGAGLSGAYARRAVYLARRHAGTLWRLLRRDPALRRQLADSEKRLDLTRWSLGEGNSDS